MPQTTMQSEAKPFACLMFARAIVVLLASMLVVPGGLAETALPPLSIRIDACSRVAKVVKWVYQQRNAGADQSATSAAILDMNISEILGPQITSITDELSREGLRKVILKAVGQAYSFPRGARTPSESEALYFQGCAQGAAVDEQKQNK